MKNAVFGMLRHVALVRTDVSEVRIASTIRVTRISELGTRYQLLAISPQEMKAIHASETSVLTGVTRHHIPEYGILQILHLFIQLSEGG
jgi:hypothetical protein